MTDDRMTVLAIKGLIADLPEDERLLVMQLHSTLVDTLKIHKQNALLALTLLGSQLQTGEVSVNG